MNYKLVLNIFKQHSPWKRSGARDSEPKRSWLSSPQGVCKKRSSLATVSYIYYDVSMSSAIITTVRILCDAIIQYKNKSWTWSSEKHYWSRTPQVLIDRRNSVWSILLPDTLGIPWWLIFIISHCRWANVVKTSRGILCRIFPEKQCVEKNIQSQSSCYDTLEVFGAVCICGDLTYPLPASPYSLSTLRSSECFKVSTFGQWVCSLQLTAVWWGTSIKMQQPGQIVALGLS